MDQRFRLIKFKMWKSVNFPHTSDDKSTPNEYTVAGSPWYWPFDMNSGGQYSRVPVRNRYCIMGIALPQHFVLVLISMQEIIRCYLSDSYSMASIPTHECSIAHVSGLCYLPHDNPD